MGGYKCHVWNKKIENIKNSESILCNSRLELITYSFFVDDYVIMHSCVIWFWPCFLLLRLSFAVSTHQVIAKAVGVELLE